MRVVNNEVGDEQEEYGQPNSGDDRWVCSNAAFQGFEDRVSQREVNYMTTSLKSMKSEKRSPRR